jgi:hypothetical protein
MLFFCKNLSLLVNKQEQRTMKTAIKYFWPFRRFRIEGRKKHNSDLQSHFSMSKIYGIFLNFFFIEEYQKRRPTFINNVFWLLWLLMYFFTKNGPNFWPSILKQPKGQKYFYGSFHNSLVLLIRLACRKITLVTVKSAYGRHKVIKNYTFEDLVLGPKYFWPEVVIGPK